jgi:hypothetical protein
LYASHLSASAAASSGAVDSDGNKSASEDELLQVSAQFHSSALRSFCFCIAFAFASHQFRQWSATLSFEAYHNAWEAVASTASDLTHSFYGSSTNSNAAATTPTTPLPLSFQSP